jgi:hypothetical protein
LAQLKARQVERKQEELAQSTSQPSTYGITLKNASSPGLPPPMVRKKSEKAADEASGQSPDQDILLQEALKILVDYIDLVGAQPKGPRLAPSAGPS